jgi:hypothetical protein
MIGNYRPKADVHLLDDSCRRLLLSDRRYMDVQNDHVKRREV